MKVILTGATGIIGREILAELLTSQEVEEVVCLVRRSKTHAAHSRIELLLKNIATETDLDYDKALQKIKVLDTSTDKPRSYQKLVSFLVERGEKKWRVLHLASNTNLSPLSTIEDDLFNDCYHPTIDLLSVTIPFIEQFSFVSTAFSCGHQKGVIPNEYLEMEINNNRNYYERLKHQAEMYVKEKCEQLGIRWQIIRPSIVSGRLLRKPYYYTPKFNVFYAWGGFFHSLQKNGVDCSGIRIAANMKSGVNIIPSDYVAKSAARAFTSSHVTELNVIHSHVFPNKIMLPTMLDRLGIKNYEFVEQVPSKFTLAEKLYYKTAGMQFTPYINTHEHQFDASKVREVAKNIPEPSINDHFAQLFEYAVQREFVDESI